MQVVVNIPNGMYEQIKDSNTIFRDDERTCYEAVQNGIPLPKGHGRLKDVDYGLKNCKDEHEIEYWDKEVPTIIEAEKESEE